MRQGLRYVALAAAVALAGLAGADGVAAQQKARVVFWQFGTRPAYIEAWKTTIAAFHEKNPDIDVAMEVVPWGEQQQRLITALTAGGLPDVSFLGNNVVAQFQAIGALEPMDRYFEAESKRLGRDITADFWPGDKAYYFLKGHWWASPLAVETRVLYYRKDLFRKAGLDPETPPRNWDEMLQAAAKLTSDGVYGWAAPMSIQYLTIQNFMAVYLSHGGRLVNDAGKCAANTPEFQAALDKYTAAFKTHVTAPDATTLEGDRFRRGFIEGRFAMIVDQPGVWHDLQLANPPHAKEVGLAPVPAGPKGRFGFLGGFPLVLWKASKVKDAAAKWMLYATSPEGGLRELSVKSGMIPARSSLAHQDPWTGYPYTVFTAQMAQAYPYTYPREGVPQMAQLEVKPVQAAVQAVAMGQKTAAQATKELCDEVNAILERGLVKAN